MKGSVHHLECKPFSDQQNTINNYCWIKYLEIKMTKEEVVYKVPMQIVIMYNMVKRLLMVSIEGLQGT